MIRSSPAGIDCGPSCSAAFHDGTGVTLSATPDRGWRFDGWSGACSGSGDCTVAMNADATVTATFAAEQPPPPPPPPAPPPPPPPPSTDECAGLAPPAPGAPNVFQMISGSHWSCERAAVDGSGNLALTTTHYEAEFVSEIAFLDPSGAVKETPKKSA
jgi:hypothetical protein